MPKEKSLFSHRYGAVALVVILVCSISFITRIVLFVKSWPNLELSFFRFAGIFLIGFFYDLVVGSFFAIPVAVYCWLMKDSWYARKWQRIPLFSLIFIITFILVSIAGSEIIFWNEFNVRFNFIAVDYLIYTNEVLGNIWESYNMPLIISGIVLVTCILLFSLRKKIVSSEQVSMHFVKRTLFLLCFLTVPTAAYFLVNDHFKSISNNNYVNELGGNGVYEFGAAFWNNEIDYHQFYKERNDLANFALLRKMLAAPNATFSADPLSIERKIISDSPQHKWNIVLISVESLSGDYLKYFGNKENITPYLDSLIPKSLFFSNFYATGTRTVRGLEALSLSIPPTPGQSIVRRPNNEGLFSLGSVLKSNGYDVNFIYGGNSFFDNMGYFFSHNNYKVLDKGDIPARFVHHTTAWGIDDEASFNFTLEQCDESYKNGKPFFDHVMTISNHRPYTFPDGRIDIPSSAQSQEGGVKYTDYAIHQFLTDAAKKPWFNNTLFVIVADHCSRSAGKTDLPVNRYHIPCFIFAPKLIKPMNEARLTSQIDLAPTLLGLLNLPYTSLFFGTDIFQTPVWKDRAFISTYQNLGYIRNGTLVILSPQKKISTFTANFSTGTAKQIPDADTLTNEAIAWYQGANYLFKNGKYKSLHSN
ncbi:MAG: sulfatase [Ferruginibacter sp.]|nr:sulfatase [Ferruginibacter sp.]